MDNIVINNGEPNTPRRATLVLSNSGNHLIVPNMNSSGKYSNNAAGSYKKRYVRQVTGRHNDTELHLAAQRGDAEAVKQILNEIDAQMVGTLSSADFDAGVAEIRSAIVNDDVNELGETALFIAADKGHLHVVNELLQYASLEGLSLKNDLGFDPLHVAASRGHLGIYIYYNYNMHNKYGRVKCVC